MERVDFEKSMNLLKKKKNKFAYDVLNNFHYQFIDNCSEVLLCKISILDMFDNIDSFIGLERKFSLFLSSKFIHKTARTFLPS